MMVIKGKVPANTFGTHLSTVEFMLPADACVWTQTSSSDGYDLGTAHYVLDGTVIAITDGKLGVIGKSGRFVQISS